MATDNVTNKRTNKHRRGETVPRRHYIFSAEQRFIKETDGDGDDDSGNIEAM